MSSITLSVVIVNYNVRYFLEQCLQSVFRAGRDLAMEVLVVDNSSVDGSCAMVRNNFPEVILIDNLENVGFARANNQAIRIAKGDYILILNPDTVVDELTFVRCLEFFSEHPECGALGVKMIDGKGHFLPESKRALPTPWVSFYKIFGFSALFPRSRKFGQYHLGYLDKEKTHPVEVLPGAFMMIPAGVLKKVGLLDEEFFMYGEDIDLSYRIIKGGYQNYYFPGTTIIHYKGESTKKGSINYVLVFYQAMIIFANKHFSAKNARLYTISIRLAIYFRALLSLVNRFLTRALIPAIDALILFAGFWILNPWWEHLKFPEGGGHPPEFLRIFVPAYILIWMVSIFFSGGYDRPYNLMKFGRGMVAGSAIILVLYALLPEEYRFSRALILLGTLWGILLPVLIRFSLHLTRLPSFRLSTRQRKRLVIIGSPEEASRVTELLRLSGQPHQVAGRVNPASEQPLTADLIGTLDQMADIIRINRIDEVVFCNRDLKSGDIIRLMLAWSLLQVDFKIAPSEGEAIIGSNSAHTPGDLYRIPVNSVGEAHNRRLKRLFDLITAALLLLLFPISWWIWISKPLGLLLNITRVLTGSKSWVGFAAGGTIAGYELPAIKPGILSPAGPEPNLNLTPEQWLRINLDYARDYTLRKDITIVLRNIRVLNN